MLSCRPAADDVTKAESLEHDGEVNKLVVVEAKVDEKDVELSPAVTDTGKVSLIDEKESDYPRYFNICMLFRE